MEESIKAFVVQLDLDNCKSLYDYIREEHYERPESGWDLLSIITRAKQSPHNISRSNTAIAFINRLALAHIDKGYFEKQIQIPKDQSQTLLSNVFSSELSQPSLPPWLLPVFEPGDSIKGKVLLELTDPVKADNVTLEHFGAACVCHKLDNKTYEREEYFKGKTLLWLWNGSTADTRDTIQSAYMKMGDALTVGHMEFPFKFQIPSDARPTVPPLVHNSDVEYAHISYFLKATVKRKDCFRNTVCNQPLWVDRPVELNRNAHNLTPYKVQQTKKVGIFNRNNIIHCTVSIPKRVFLRGEDIQVSVEIENKSDAVISRVMSCIEISGTFRVFSFFRPHTRNFWHRSIERNSGAVNSGMCSSFRLDTPQKFTTIDGALVPACPLEDCRIITVAYQVIVEVCIKGMHLNMETRIPIDIATKNSSQFYSGAE